LNIAPSTVGRIETSGELQYASAIMPGQVAKLSGTAKVERGKWKRKGLILAVGSTVRWFIVVLQLLDPAANHRRARFVDFRRR
jgi:hypothetical protein